MPDQETTREEELRQLLTDAIEVQLAALKAGIGFWSDWIEQTTEFVDSATKTLTNINSDDPNTKDVLLELVDAGRASARRMTELPRNTATRFLEELDRFEEEKAEAEVQRSAAKKVASKSASKKKSKSAAKSTRSRSASRAGRSPRSTAKKTRARKKAAKKTRRRRAGRVKE